MSTINVQFSDGSKSTIISYFNSPQSDIEYENIGTVDTSDERWASFYNGAGPVQKLLPVPTKQ